MPKFSYSAIDSMGQEATGVMTADSRSAMELALFEKDLRDVRITDKKGILQFEISAQRVKREEVMHLSR